MRKQQITARASEPPSICLLSLHSIVEPTLIIIRNSCEGLLQVARFLYLCYVFIFCIQTT